MAAPHGGAIEPESPSDVDDPLLLAAAQDPDRFEPRARAVPLPKHAAFGHVLSANSFEFDRNDLNTHLTVVREARRDEVRRGFSGEAEHAQCVALLRTHGFVVATLSGCASLHRCENGAAPSVLADVYATWTQTMGARALQKMRWDVLGAALHTCDAITVRTMWTGIQLDGKEAEGCCSSMPCAVRRRLFNTVGDFSTIEMLKCAICTCRTPLFVAELLGALERELAEKRAAQASSAVVSILNLEEKADLVALAFAIADAVFSSDKTKGQKAYEADHAAWRAKFVEGASSTLDSVFNARAWKGVVVQLLRLAKDGVPGRLLETLTRQREHTLGVLQLAVRYCDHDVFLLTELLSLKNWSVGSLAEAFREALSLPNGVRGPNIATVLGMLYEKLVRAWTHRSQRATPLWDGTAASTDAIATPWHKIVVCAVSLEEVDLDATSTLLIPRSVVKPYKRTAIELDAEVWLQVVDAMVKAHEADPADASSAVRDHASPLFGSLIRIALCACVGRTGRTNIVEYFLKLAIANNTAPAATSWHDINLLVGNVADYYPELFGMVVKSMLTDAPADLRAANKERFENALGDAVFFGFREPTRLIVEALAPFGLPECITDCAESGTPKHWLLREWVAHFGEGCTPLMRNRFGGTDFAAFQNAKVEAQLVAVLEGRDWSDGAKTSALATAVKQRFPVAAQVLLRPKYNVKLPAKADGWLTAISEFLYRPGQACAKAVVDALTARAGTPEAKEEAEEEEEEPAAKRARAA